MYAKQWPPLENEKCPNFLELAWEAAGDDWSAFKVMAGLQTCPAAPRIVERCPVLAQQMWPHLCIASDVLQERTRPCSQIHRHRSAQPLSPSPLCSPLCAANRSCCPQDCAPFTVIHSTRRSHWILSSFFFPPAACLYTLAQQRWYSTEAQLSVRDRPKKKPEQLLQAELHLAGSSSSTRNRWAWWSPKAIIAL